MRGEAGGGFVIQARFAATVPGGQIPVRFVLRRLV